jgi:hypothetical protein
MKIKMLNVKAVEGKLQPNFEAFEAGVRRFVGWSYDPTVGEVDEKGVPQGGFVMLPSASVPCRAEYIQAVKLGDLEVVDQASAVLCGVKFVDSK